MDPNPYQSPPLPADRAEPTLSRTSATRLLRGLSWAVAGVLAGWVAATASMPLVGAAAEGLSLSPRYAVVLMVATFGICMLTGGLGLGLLGLSRAGLSGKDRPSGS